MSFRRSLQLGALQLFAVTGLVAATSVVAYVVQPDSESPSTTAPGRSAVAAMEAAASQLTVAPADSGVVNPELRMLGRLPFDGATSTVVVAAPDRIPISFVIDTTTTVATTPVTVTTAPNVAASPPAPTTTQPKPATTTPPATTPPPPPSIGGSFGAASVGPGQEVATTEGTLIEGSNHVSAIEGASPGETILLRGGSYSGGFSVPPGVTVKPYNGESVTISGQVTMSSNSVIAGLNLTSSGQWTIRVDGSSAKQNVTIRNNAVSGGSIETIRVSRNAKDVLITGNDLSGGGNHVIKIHGEGSGHAPSATIHNNVIRSPQREDGVQTEDNGPVTIDRNTFSGTPENGVDVKTGQRVTITRNLFDGKTLSQAALLVHGRGDAVVADNRFASGANVELGSKGSGDATMNFKGNILEGGYISIRYSTRPVVVDGNVMKGGVLKLGISGGDHPRDARVLNNLFEGTELLDRVSSAGASWSCTGNTLVKVLGDWSKCS